MILIHSTESKHGAAAHARDDYSDEHAELFDELADIKDDTIQKLSDGITRIPLFPAAGGQHTRATGGAGSNLSGYESSIATAANQLLSQYRDANRRANFAASTPFRPSLETAAQLS